MPVLKFLIISSDSKLRKNIKNRLGSLEYLDKYTKDGKRGLQMAQSGEFDIIIIDLTGSGSKDIDHLKQLTGTDSTGEIIVVTDSNNKKRAVEIFGDRAWTYLLEPFTPDELKAAVTRIDDFIRLTGEMADKLKWVAHLEVIYDIARESLLSDNSEKLLWFIVREIHKKLGFFNVNIFEIDEKQKCVVLKAFAGGFGDDMVVGYSLQIGEGIVGWAAHTRESQLSEDVKSHPHRIQGFEFEECIQSELAVPIMFENRVLGVLHVESDKRDAFSQDDVMVLETLTDQISLTFEKMRLSRELREIYELVAMINNSLPISILIVNKDLVVEHVNRTFCEISYRSKEEILNKPVEHVLSEDTSQSINLTNELMNVLEHGISVSHNNIRHTSPSHPDKVLNFTFVRVRDGEFPLVMILIQDVTEDTRKTYQLSLLREISIAMQGVLERDKLLHLILTCVTAGFAIGFNRAFIFLLNESRNELQGIMGVGPQSREEAYRIWAELSSRQFTFQEYLESIQKGTIERGGLQDIVENMVFDLNTTDNILTETATSGHHIHVLNAWEDSKVDESMKQFITDEFVSIPLIARNKIIGVLLADNAFSESGIDAESFEVLTMFAAQAGIAIENARILVDLEEKVKELLEAYIELEKTHDILVRNEKLAAIGEVSARIAHEIRNPLSTIGGFAKSIPKKYDNRERTVRNAEIIVNEVERLEKILSNILDFSKPNVPQKVLNDVHELIREILNIMEEDIVSKNIIVAMNITEEKIETELDASQIKQVLINVTQNAINSMDEGGTIEIRTMTDGTEAVIEIIDTGRGIPEQYLDDIFEPFFTTTGNGTGLGLSISNRIIQSHQGRFEIMSKEGKGTTVRIVLPISI